jgi:hypothetical protein
MTQLRNDFGKSLVNIFEACCQWKTNRFIKSCEDKNMGWMSRVRIVYNTVVDATIDAVASTLSACGTFACAAGGMGFAAMQAVEKTFSASFYGSGEGAGGLNILGSLDNVYAGINETLPVHVSGKKDGQILYNLGNYVDNHSIQMISMVFVGSGIVLRNMGDNLKKWQEHRCDARYIYDRTGMALARPSAKEMLFANASSVSTSLSIALLSHSVSSFLVYSDWLNKKLYLTYPFSTNDSVEEPKIKSDYYHGPVASGTYPIDYKLDPEVFPFSLWSWNVTLGLNMTLNGLANATYGGGLFFKENNPISIPPKVTQAASAVLGVGAYYASNLFFKRERRLRDERMMNSESYTLVGDRKC